MNRDAGMSMETTGLGVPHAGGVDGDGARKAAKQKTSPVLFVGLAVAVALGGSMILRAKQPVSLASRMPEAPALLAAQPGCGDQGAAALARGTESEQAAIAKAERYAFDPHDGVDAVHLYGLSASCYTTAGEQAGARRTGAAEAAWRRKLDGQYQSHRLRLRLALDRGQKAEAYKQARALRALLRDETGPYVEWLAAIERTYKPAEKGRRSSKKKS